MPIGVIKRQHKESIATFKIKVPIFIARQVMRHRQFSYQELSRRYTDDESVPFKFWIPQNNKAFIFQNIVEDALKIYRRLVKRMNVQPEIARAVLPVGLYTELWMQGDVPAWKNHFALRLDQHTQKEHRELAQAMLDLLEKHQLELWEKVKP